MEFTLNIIELICLIILSVFLGMLFCKGVIMRLYEGVRIQAKCIKDAKKVLNSPYFKAYERIMKEHTEENEKGALNAEFVRERDARS